MSGMLWSHIKVLTAKGGGSVHQFLAHKKCSSDFISLLGIMNLALKNKFIDAATSYS